MRISISIRVALCGATLFGTAICVAPLRAQSTPQPLEPSPGFGATQLWEDYSLPWGVPGFAIGIGPDDLFVAHGDELRLYDPTGNYTVAHALPQFHAIGLMQVEPFGLDLYFTDFQTSQLHRLDLVTQSVTSSSVPANTYSLATHAATGRVFVNANPLWPAPGAATGVWLVDPSGGHVEIAHLSGPSGPIAVDANGDVLVAVLPNSIPPLPGSVQVLRFRASQIQARLAGGPLLHAADASATLTGLDGAYDMAFDNRGRLLITDANNRVIRRTTPGALQLEPQPFSAPGHDDILGLQFVDLGPGTLDAYQPGTGCTLYVATVDYGRRTAIHAVRPARPACASSVGAQVPPGAFALDLTGLPSSASVALCLSAAPALLVERNVLSLDGRRLWLGLDLAVPIVTVNVGPTAVDGTLRLPFTHAAGGLGYSITLQAIALDSLGGGAALVSAPPLELSFAP